MSRKRYPRRIATCKHCGEQGPYAARGWINSCYKRWLDRDKPEDGPPPALGHAGYKAARLEDYVELTREHKLTPQEATDRLRICRRTRFRYEAELREQEEEAA